MLRGLFIGIDKYSSPVTRLTCAAADAVALASLFRDTHTGEVAELLDEAATGDGIRRELALLGSAAEDDVVIISFSGHGTEAHQLVPVDVDVDNLEVSCVALSEVANALDRIPSKHLVVFLDCCFSGGFGGSRVFALAQTRSPLEDRTSVEGLARGSGRIVITASGAGEPALETSEFGHGLLSHFVIEGLQGKDGIGSDNRIPLTELFAYAMRSVLDTADRMHEVQTPTLYGTIEGAPSFERLVAGASYAAAFPSRVRPPAQAEWTSLAPYGLRQEYLERWAKEMAGLNDLQLSAINEHGLLDGRSILVVAPTGAGKTMIGELSALQAVSNGSRSVMLLPLRALVNDKYEYMTRVYGDSLTTVRATGEYGDQVGAILNGQFDLALLTYEKFLNLALAFPHIMRTVSLVVVDEVQTVGDRGRGASLEFLLTLLRSGHGRTNSPQVVALSAVIGDTRGFEHWLGGTLLRTTERPVPLQESVLDASGSLQVLEADGTLRTEAGFIQPAYVGGSRSNKPYVIPLVRRLVADGKKVIVFRSYRGDTVGTAQYLAQALGLPGASDAIGMLPEGDQAEASTELRSTLQHGVAFHNSDLDSAERRAVEMSFRDAESHLRVVVATTTLAMGVNTPAEAVVIAGLTHPQNQPYSIAEYKNMAGRAGRPGHVEAGESYIVATGNPSPGTAWSGYVLGSPEEIQSHFMSDTTDGQTLILRCLVALKGSVNADGLRALLDNSFAVWLLRESGRPGWEAAALDHDTDALIDAELVDREPNGDLTLTDLGRYAGESGVEVRSITQISSMLRFAPDALSVPDLVLLAQVSAELDENRIPANKRSRQEKQRWPATLPRLGVSPSLIGGLHVGGGDPLQRAKRGCACLLFMTDLPLAQVEANLLQHDRSRSAAGPIRSVAARTRDVIDTVARVAVFRGKTLADESGTDDLALRLELGLPREVIPLAHLAGPALTRAQYLQLLRNGASTPEAVLGLPWDELRKLIGEDPARQLAELLQEPDAVT